MSKRSKSRKGAGEKSAEFVAFEELTKKLLSAPKPKPEPARVFPPGATIRREMKARGMEHDTLSDLLGCAPKELDELLEGKMRLTKTTAAKLEDAFGASAQFWMNLENAYRSRTLKSK